MLAMRLEKILPRFICSTQTGFIKGRYILENLITSWEAMDWAKVSGQHATMFLLDFKKVYDRVEWGFILLMLESFGFPGEFFYYVRVLLQDGSAQIDVNGSLSPPISLSCSIRQGCPLALALFVIASDALYYLLRDSSLSPKVNGVRLPDDNELINIQFADDTALFVELTKTNIDHLNQKLHLFGSISGARISKAKSTFLSWKEHPPDWFENFEYQWGGLSKIVRYLGAPFLYPPP
ncbi:uncharacterized protein LOC131875229 [Cryptomeria japonica]|uniref:uncharacterized protein LOC131875229 n=1 Tax=Cryptomeria japonica TaxID=3369 RepID=UPI0027D9F20C|nr:uncharacterized protein LOC131875229 [Cryptomeria japonica]